MRVILLAVITLLAMPFGAGADLHYFSMKQVFPSGKCSPVIPNFEVLRAGFVDGEITQYTSFINKERDQWALVGSKTETTIIFCLYASGIGPGSVNSLAVKSD